MAVSRNYTASPSINNRMFFIIQPFLITQTSLITYFYPSIDATIEVIKRHILYN